MMGMMGPWMILWLVTAVAVVALGVAGAIWIARSQADRSQADRSLTDRSGAPGLPAGPDRAQEELRRRYAAGEIGREEYLQGKIDLEP